MSINLTRAPIKFLFFFTEKRFRFYKAYIQHILHAYQYIQNLKASLFAEFRALVGRIERSSMRLCSKLYDAIKTDSCRGKTVLNALGRLNCRQVAKTVVFGFRKAI